MFFLARWICNWLENTENEKTPAHRARLKIIKQHQKKKQVQKNDSK